MAKSCWDSKNSSGKFEFDLEPSINSQIENEDFEEGGKEAWDNFLEVSTT